MQLPHGNMAGWHISGINQVIEGGEKEMDKNAYHIRNQQVE